MAEAADIQTQPFYLKKAKLKGYKSIKDAEVEFCDGLNIIIGKNASGKSNLLEILFKTLKLNTDNHFPTNTELTLNGMKDLKIISNYTSNNRIRLNPQSRKISEETEFKFIYDGQDTEEFFELNISFIEYDIPDSKSYPIIARPFNFRYYSNKDYVYIDYDNFETDRIIYSQLLLFIINQILNFTHPEFLALPQKELDLEKLKNEFNLRMNQKINGISQLFYDLIPIEEIRFNPLINIHFDKELEVYTISNIFLEYKINGNWLPYSSLSDGTKRLFYIISEFYIGPSAGGLAKLQKEFRGENISKNIILIEEPELGIHPHQLHRLMTFIKEQSRDKQIILSTHSPMVLDILGKDDLHRIIIASNDDPKKGSQFRHLTEKEKEKAKLYMDNYFLSDYWKHSDLE